MYILKLKQIGPVTLEGRNLVLPVWVEKQITQTQKLPQKQE